MKRARTLVAACAVAALVLGYLIGKATMPEVQAQGMVSNAGNTIVVAGAERSARIPIFLVDTREQTVCVYRYDFNANSLELSAARSYEWDKKIQQYGRSRGPTPAQVRSLVTRNR